MNELIISSEVRDRVALLCVKLDDLILWVAAQATKPNEEGNTVISMDTIEELDGLLESTLLKWMDERKNRKSTTPG